MKRLITLTALATGLLESGAAYAGEQTPKLAISGTAVRDRLPERPLSPLPSESSHLPQSMTAIADLQTR
jgi:hypothetical protein